MAMFDEASAPEEDAGGEEQLPPIHPDAKKNKEVAVRRLLRIFSQYRSWRTAEMEPEWDAIYDAYHGVPQKNNYPYRSNYILREIFRQVESLKPLVIQQVFPDDNKFNYKPLHEGGEDAAIASTLIVQKHLQVFGLDTEIRKWVEQAILYGTSFLQYSWRQYRSTKRKISVVHSDENKEAWDRKSEEVIHDGPSLEWVDLRKLYADPLFEDPRNSPVVFIREVVSGSYIKTQIREGRFDPEEGKKAFQKANGAVTDYKDASWDTANSLRESGEASSDDDEYVVLTCYTNDGWVYTIIGDQFLVEAQYNPFIRAPILTVKNYPQAGELYGVGEPAVIMGDQKYLNDVVSMQIDSIHYNLNPMWKVRSSERKNWNITSFKPGGAVYVEDMAGVVPLETKGGVAELTNLAGWVTNNMQLATGVTNEVTGAGSAQRTATGIVRLQNAASLRINNKVSWMIPSFVELYRVLYNMEARFLDERVAIRMMGQDGKEAFKSAPPSVFEPDVDVEIEVPPTMETQQERQTKYQLLWGMIAQDPRFNHEKVALELLRSFGLREPRAGWAGSLSTQTDIMGEITDHMGTGVMAPAKPSQNHQLYIQMLDMYMASPIFQQMPIQAQHYVFARKQQHLGYFQQIVGATGGTASAPSEGNQPEGTPGGEGAREAQFSNAEVGANSSGVMAEPDMMQSYGLQ